jgi:hypothetical protein
MSDGGSFFATGYLLLALNSTGDSQSLETALELAQYLFPVLEAKSRNASLSKDEAFIFSQMYEHGIGCPADSTEAARLKELSEESLSRFKLALETRSRERLISLHLQLLVHATSCTLCSSNNCKKMKVTLSLIPPLQLTLPFSIGVPLSPANLCDRLRWPLSTLSPGQEFAEAPLSPLFEYSLHNSSL